MSVVLLRQVIFVLACVLLAPCAWADKCPTVESAKAGFVLKKQGVVTEVRRGRDGLTFTTNRYSSGKEQKAISFRGLFDLIRLSPDGPVFDVPLTDLRKLFPLSPGAKRVFTILSGDADKSHGALSIEMSVGRKESLTFGQCSYPVLPIRHRFMGEDGNVVDEWTGLYSVDLGFLLGKRYSEGGGEVTVQYESIGTLADTTRN